MAWVRGRARVRLGWVRVRIRVRVRVRVSSGRPKTTWAMPRRAEQSSSAPPTWEGG